MSMKRKQRTNLKAGNPEQDKYYLMFNNEIDDMNNNNRDHSSNDLLNDMYSHIDHDNVDWKQMNHHNLYTLSDDELQLSSDLEDLD